MKKVLILLVVLVGSVTVGLLLPGEDAEALACVRCMLGGVTSPVWGFGSTCAAATNDAINQAYALIPASCDLCGETVIGVAPCDTSCSDVANCYTPYGEWRVDVKIRYRCEVDLCTP